MVQEEEGDAFLAGFARFAEASVESPLRLLNDAEAAVGLTPDQGLAVALLAFLAAGPVAAALVIRSARGGVGAKLLGFAAFYLWMNLGMGVECAYLSLPRPQRLPVTLPPPPFQVLPPSSTNPDPCPSRLTRRRRSPPLLCQQAGPASATAAVASWISATPC